MSPPIGFGKEGVVMHRYIYRLPIQGTEELFLGSSVEDCMFAPYSGADEFRHLAGQASQDMKGFVNGGQAEKHGIRFRKEVSFFPHPDKYFPVFVDGGDGKRKVVHAFLWLSIADMPLVWSDRPAFDEKDKVWESGIT